MVHTVMPKRLAQALMESSMQHFDTGGQVNTMDTHQYNQAGAMPRQQIQTQGTGPTTQGGNTQGDLTSGAQGAGNFLVGMYGGDFNSLAHGQAPQSATGLMNMGQGGMNAFKDIGAAITPQSGYQAQAPGISTQNFQPGLNQLQNQQSDVYGQQAGLANQLLAQTQGYGPNPAQAQLAQNTGQNVANQAALMASQRGASANPALLARQAAMQGANTQQQAVGQAATLGAQQQLSAQNALAQQQGQMQNQNLQGQSILQGGQAAQNTAINAGQLGAQNINANTANANAAAAGQGVGGLLSGAGAALSSLFYKGGEVKKMADGGYVNDNIGIANYAAPVIAADNPFAGPSQGSQAMGKGIGSLGSTLAGGLLSKGGPVPEMLQGGSVPGKAKVKGDSPKNDIVPTELSPGEVVLPRSVTESDDPVGKAAEFMKHLKGGKKKSGGYKEVADSKKSLEDRVKYLEKCMGGRIV